MLHIGTHNHPTPHVDALFILMHRSNVLLHKNSFLLTLDQFQPQSGVQAVYCGQWHDKDLFVCLFNHTPQGFEEITLRELLFSVNEQEFDLISRARQLATWDNDHQYCSRCGTAFNNRHANEHTKICPKCHLRQYPRISPCVIVSIRKGNQILLARGPNSAPGHFSNLAGFVEAGESFEQAVAREVMEEVGLNITNIRYISSQPWPFPHQVMVGFFAEYASGDILPAAGEIEEAHWFNVDDLPKHSSNVSISGQLIEQHVAYIQGLK